LPIPQECFDSFQAKALERTNFYRLRHNAPEQKLSDNVELQTLARTYACKIVTDFQFIHNVKRGRYGENLSLFRSTETFDLTASECAS